MQTNSKVSYLETNVANLLLYDDKHYIRLCDDIWTTG